MAALLCLLMGIAALALAAVLPGQRLTFGLLAVVAGAAAALLTPAGSRSSNAAADHPDPVSAGDEPDTGPWERAAPL